MHQAMVTTNTTVSGRMRLAMVTTKRALRGSRVAGAVRFHAADYEPESEHRQGDEEDRDGQPEAARLFLLERGLAGQQSFIGDFHAGVDGLLHRGRIESVHRSEEHTSE